MSTEVALTSHRYVRAADGCFNCCEGEVYNAEGAYAGQCPHCSRDACALCGYTLGNHDDFRCWRLSHCDCGAIAVENDAGDKCCGQCERVVDECFCDMPR